MPPKSLTYSNAIELSPNAGSDPELLCPRCGFNYLHQGCVTVFDRVEDAEQTAVTTVAGGLAATHLRPSSEVANPSCRRQGLAIAFDCEGCGGDIELTIAQHKGCTELGWRFNPPGARSREQTMITARKRQIRPGA